MINNKRRLKMKTNFKAGIIKDEIRSVELGIRYQEAREETQQTLAQLTTLHNERARLYSKYHELTGESYETRKQED